MNVPKIISAKSELEQLWSLSHDANKNLSKGKSPK